MSQQTTIRKLAELVNTPVDKLLEQLAEAGMTFSGPDQAVTSAEKLKLLGFLKRSHGKAENAAEETAAPRKITLNRSKKQELTVGGGKNRQTVDVVVRKRVTLVKSPAAADAAAQAPVDDERAEILRKLEESKQRNLSEQKQLAELDRQRAEDAAEQRRRAEEEAARLRAEAELAAAAAGGADEDGAVRRPTGHHAPHAHAHPKPAPRADDRLGPKHKGNRGSHAMVASVEDDDTTARFAGQLHLSAAERARRTSTRGKPKARRQAHRHRGTGGRGR